MAAPVIGRLNVRWKRYISKRPYGPAHVRAVKITEKNLTDIVAYVCRYGGAATGHNFIPPKRRARIRIRLRNYGETWGKRDWRVAELGDYIVMNEFKKGEFHREEDCKEFERVKGKDFERTFKLNKV